MEVLRDSNAMIPRVRKCKYLLRSVSHWWLYCICLGWDVREYYAPAPCTPCSSWHCSRENDSKVSYTTSVCTSRCSFARTMNKTIQLWVQRLRKKDYGFLGMKPDLSQIYMSTESVLCWNSAGTSGKYSIWHQNLSMASCSSCIFQPILA